MKNLLVNRAVSTAKKNFNLRWLLVPILLIILGVGNVWGTPQTYNFSSLGTTGWTTSGTSRTINGISWTYSVSTHIGCDGSKI